jgi:hypothetical protein
VKNLKEITRATLANVVHVAEVPCWLSRFHVPIIAIVTGAVDHPLRLSKGILYFRDLRKPAFQTHFRLKEPDNLKLLPHGSPRTARWFHPESDSSPAKLPGFRDIPLVP